MPCPAGRHLKQCFAGRFIATTGEQMAETNRVDAQLPEEEETERSEATTSGESSSRSSLSTLYSSIRESLPSREDIATRASDLLASLTLVDSRPAAAQPTEVATSAGATWRRGPNGWELFGQDGQRAERYQGQVENVTRGQDGRAIITLKDGRKIHERQDGSTLEYNAQNKLSKITTPAGQTREIFWDGDQIKSVKTNSGSFNRLQNADGTYKDEWLPEGSRATSGWRGRVEVNDNGDYTLTPTDGDPKAQRYTYKADGSSELLLPDGGREVTLANKDLVKYGKDGTVSEISYQDGSKRKFEWRANAGATGEHDRHTLQSVHVFRADGKQYYHQRSGDGWNVQSLENGRWTQAQPEKLSFNVDNRTGEYSYTDDGVITRITPGRAGSEAVTTDGTRLAYNDDGSLASATREGRTRRFKFDGQGRPTEIKDGDQTWTPAPGGGWRNGEGLTRAGDAFVNANGDFGFDDNGKKTVIKMDGTEFDRLENAQDQSVVERRGNEVRITAGDGSTRQVKTEGNQVVEESVTRAGNTQTWTRGERRGDGYVWTNARTGATEVRNSVTVTDRGQLSIEYPDGRTYTSRTNGSERLENRGQGSHIEYTGGNPTQIKFADGRVRDFVWEGNQLKSLKVTSADGKSTSEWQRVGPNQWKQPGAKPEDKPWHAEIQVGTDGSYVINDKDEKTTTTRTPDGREVIVNNETNARTEKLKDQVVRVTRDGQDLEVVRDQTGVVTELRDHTYNRLYKKEGDEFKAGALDDSKPYQAPNQVARRGEARVDDRGVIMFTAADGTRVRQELGRDAQTASGPEYLRDLVENSTHLNDAARTRFRESLDAVARRSDISAQEKAECYNQMVRLMEHDGSEPFSQKQRHELVDQTAWHIANPSRNEQGQNPNCQVTDIRTSVLMSQPSAFARMMTEIGTTGTFKVADGTVITPPAASLVRRTGSEEAAFPPQPGTRTWAGKIWDVTAANVYWNRVTRTPGGQIVGAGEVVYEENPSSNRRDAGVGVYRYWEQNGSRWRQQVTGADGSALSYPGMTGTMMMDAYHQITGQEQKDRFIGHTRLGLPAGAGVCTIDSASALETQLQQGPWPKIIQIHTSHPWVHNDADGGTAGGSGGREGGEHVVVITGYDPKTKRVSVDNSWNPDKDRLSGDRRITLDQLYAAAAGKYQRPVQQQAVQQREVYYYNGRYYYR